MQERTSGLSKIIDELGKRLMGGESLLPAIVEEEPTLLGLRIPEPEIMDQSEQVIAYGKADFSKSHSEQVSWIRKFFPELAPVRILDLGCGTGDITRRISDLYPNAQITAIDGSDGMISFAQAATKNSTNASNIKYFSARIPLEEAFMRGKYDLIVSTNTLHHLSDTDAFWETIRLCSHSGTAVLITDLIRPNILQKVSELVEQRTGQELPVLKNDFFRSLCAAYRPEEIERQVHKILPWLNVLRMNETHMAVWGRSS